MTELVGKHLANYIDEFLKYNVANNTSIWRNYMRIQVLVDVRIPLKKERKVRIIRVNGALWPSSLRSWVFFALFVGV